MDIKSLLQPNLTNIKNSLVDPMSLYHINNEIIYLIISRKFKFDVFASIDSILSTSLSIRNKKPQIVVDNSGIIGNPAKKTVLFVADTTSHDVLSAISLIRSHNGICDKCIVIMDEENGLSEKFKDNKIELYSLVKKSDFGVL